MSNIICSFDVKNEVYLFLYDIQISLRKANHKNKQKQNIFLLKQTIKMRFKNAFFFEVGNEKVDDSLSQLII